MAKISRYGGASDKTVLAPDAGAAEVLPKRVVSEAGPELIGLPLGERTWEPGADAVLPPVPEDAYPSDSVPLEGDEGSWPGSSSSASTDPQQTISESSSKRNPSPAPMTGSRSRKGRTGSRSAGSTGGGRAADTSAADDEGEA